MESNTKFSAMDGALLDDPTVCRRLIGRQLFLTITRPNLTYSVHTLSQFMQAPRQPFVIQIVMDVQTPEDQPQLFVSSWEIQ